MRLSWQKTSVEFVGCSKVAEKNLIIYAVAKVDTGYWIQYHVEAVCQAKLIEF